MIVLPSGQGDDDDHEENPNALQIFGGGDDEGKNEETKLDHEETKLGDGDNGSNNTNMGESGKQGEDTGNMEGEDTGNKE